MLKRSIAATSWVFVLAMVINTAIALHYRWPAAFDAPGNPNTIATDFVLHGTRISPPPHALVILSVAGWLALYRGWRGVTGTLALVVFSLLVTIAAAGEPAGLPQNEVPPLLWLILGSIGRYAPLLLVVLGAFELLRRAFLSFTRDHERHLAESD